MKPEFTTLEEPVKLGRDRRYKILTEESFKHFIIGLGLTQKEAQKVGISGNVMYTSCTYYKEKYRNELKMVHTQNYSKSKIGNTYGKRDTPPIIFSKDNLEEMISKGKNIPQMARELKTSEYIVKRNLDYYEIRTCELPRKWSDGDLHFLKLLEHFEPNITETALDGAYYENPEVFFDSLHKAYLRLEQLSWWIKDKSKKFQRLCEQGVLKRNGKNFSGSKNENLLTWGLFERDYTSFDQKKHIGPYWFDFVFESAKLLIEADGIYHKNDAKTKERDKKKEAIAIKNGYKLLRLDEKDIRYKLTECIDRILEIVKEREKELNAKS